jgi:hypothetical protein
MGFKKIIDELRMLSCQFSRRDFLQGKMGNKIKYKNSLRARVVEVMVAQLVSFFNMGL